MNKDEKALKLKVGNKVIVGSKYNKRISIIEKITPSGLIKIDGRLYNESGNLRGSDVWCTDTFRQIDENEEKNFNEQLFCNKMINLLNNIQKIEYEKAKKIYEILEMSWYNE